MTVKDRAEDIASLRKIAEAEVKEELRRKAIDEMKEKIRRGSILTKIFPWKIALVRRDKC